MPTLPETPNWRGEDYTSKPTVQDKAETPPLAWGRLRIKRFREAQRGNTPTGVGKTFRTPTSTRRTWKHPHWRGEDQIELLAIGGDQETPPLAWGR